MKKYLILIPIILFLASLAPLGLEARSGCCSHHDGVCGCKCCDGTFLSATCAPYYPQCSTPKLKPIEQPPIVKQLMEQNTDNNSIDSNKLLAELPKENNGGSFWWRIIGIGFGGFFLYNIIKRRK